MILNFIVIYVYIKYQLVTTALTILNLTILTIIGTYCKNLKLKLKLCTNMGVFIQVYPTGLLFT